MRTVPRDVGRSWHTDIVKPENVCTGEPAMSDDSVAKWNCTSGRDAPGIARANMPPWLMPTAIGPRRRDDVVEAHPQLAASTCAACRWS